MRPRVESLEFLRHRRCAKRGLLRRTCRSNRPSITCRGSRSRIARAGQARTFGFETQNTRRAHSENSIWHPAGSAGCRTDGLARRAITLASAHMNRCDLVTIVAGNLSRMVARGEPIREANQDSVAARRVRIGLSRSESQICREQIWTHEVRPQGAAQGCAASIEHTTRGFSVNRIRNPG